MTDLNTVNRFNPDLSEATLSELTAIAISERDLAEADLAGALGHTVQLGHVLIEARQRFPHGGWMEWVENDLTLSRRTASVAMRLAKYIDHLPQEALTVRTGHRGELRSPSIAHAMKILSGLPDTFPRNHYRSDEATRAEARQLRAQGHSIKETADLIGVHPDTIRYWCDPTFKRQRNIDKNKRLKQARRAQQALKEQERRQEAIKLAADIGGPLAEAYAHVRRLALSLDSAASSTPLGREALSLCHRCEDQIIAALKATRMDFSDG